MRRGNAYRQSLNKRKRIRTRDLTYTVSTQTRTSNTCNVPTCIYAYNFVKTDLCMRLKLCIHLHCVWHKQLGETIIVWQNWDYCAARISKYE